MSTPQGPGRYGADRDPDQQGSSTWGTPPPGGWGRPDPDEMYPDDRDPGGRYPDEPGPRDRDPRDRDQGGRDLGGWDPGPSTQAWAPDAGTRPVPGGRRRAEDRPDAERYPGGPDDWDAPRTEPRGAPWGDPVDPRHPADPYDDGYADPRYPDTQYSDPRYADPRYPDERPDPWADDPDAATTAVPGRFAPGDEPWAPREAVRTPWRGPGGLGARAVGGIVAAVVVVIALLVALFWVPGWAVSRTLDKTALQNGVTQILTQSYGVQVGAVECPDDVDVETGTTFSCQALVDGEQVTVPGTVTSDEGDYQVGRV